MLNLYFKSLILFADNGELHTLADRVKAATDLGVKTFKRDDFKVIDVLGRYSYGYVAVYEFERSTGSVCVGNLSK